MLVYTLGGVAAGRGGDYSIGSTTLVGGDSEGNPSEHSLDLGEDHNDKGTYLRFNNVTGSSFTLTATPTLVRAPVNGIQIIQRIPEPASMSFAGLVVGAALLRRRRYNPILCEFLLTGPAKMRVLCCVIHEG